MGNFDFNMDLDLGDFSDMGIAAKKEAKYEWHQKRKRQGIGK